jgi:Uma2 family endonuclease
MTSLKIDLLELLKKPGAVDEELRQRLLNALQNPVQNQPMTYEEFLDWADEDTLAEWVNGDVIMATPASDRHQDIVSFLAAIFRAYVETHNLGVIRPAPFQMRVGESGREPDILFLSNEHISRLKPTYLDGPADLVVEVLSPESGVRDRGEKFYEYEKAGIPEYWLIDPEREQAEFYQLDERGRYQAAALVNGRYRSRTLAGFWLDVDWLWDPPPVLKVCKELELI